MKFVDLFPTVILGEVLKDIPQTLLKKYIDTVLDEEYINNGEHGLFTKNQKLLDNPIFKKLKNHILNYSKIYLDEMGHIYEDLQIINSWGNILNSNKEYIPSHDHSNSYISGTFYLTSGSSIQFKSPLMNQWKYVPVPSPSEKDLSFRGINYYNVPIKPNLLLLFPSHLNHLVPSSTLKEKRLSIAFNIIPKGEFGNNTAKLYL